MPSSTSSSDKRFLTAFLLTFLVLAGAWELVLRARAGETVEFAIIRPQMTVPTTAGEKWIVFGNCLVMTGISPAQITAELAPRRDRVILNIASHEQSPIAYFEYLRRAKQYPDVIITNVSSWINGTNFEQETQLLTQTDPLGLAAPSTSGSAGAPAEGGAYRHQDSIEGGTRQKQVEEAIARTLGEHVQIVGHRYHLFDFMMFLGTLATSADLDNALYQLQIQSWFRVSSSETDGQGFVGLHVDYRADWPTGVDVMAERYLKRMRLSRLLTPVYWSLLEENIRDFESHGTQVLLVRMPEHPQIRVFNDETYDLRARLTDLSTRTKVKVLDLSALGPADGVHLFDSVHPDAAAAQVIARRLGAWLRTLDLTTARRP
jgi:hypothetical protein